MKRNVSIVCVCIASNCSLVVKLLRNAGFGSEWDTLYYTNVKPCLLLNCQRRSGDRKSYVPGSKNSRTFGAA
jgi:hypothetical protein